MFAAGRERKSSLNTCTRSTDASQDFRKLWVPAATHGPRQRNPRAKSPPGGFQFVVLVGLRGSQSFKREIKGI